MCVCVCVCDEHCLKKFVYQLRAIAYLELTGQAEAKCRPAASSEGTGGDKVLLKHVLASWVFTLTTPHASPLQPPVPSRNCIGRCSPTDVCQINMSLGQ